MEMDSTFVRNTRETIDELSNHELRRFFHRGISEDLYRVLPKASKMKLKRAKVVNTSGEGIPYQKVFGGKRYDYYTFLTNPDFVSSLKLDLKARNARHRVIRTKDGYEVFVR